MPVNVTTGAKVGQPVTVTAELGDNLQHMVDLYGEEMVYDRALRSLKISLQSWIMEQIKHGKSEEEIKTGLKDWKPGQGRQRRSPLERLRDELAKLSPEEKAAFFKEQKAKAAA